MTREEVIALATRIEDLRREIARLDSLRQELEIAEKRLDTALESGRGKRNAALGGQIASLLDSKPDVDFTFEDLFEAFPDENKTSVRSAAARAYSTQKLIARPARGKYCSKKRFAATAAAQPNGAAAVREISDQERTAELGKEW